MSPHSPHPVGPASSRLSLPPRGSRGFSLVEVALALGIASFVLVTLIGLLLVGIRTSKAAHDKTLVGSLVGGVLASLETTDYTTFSNLGTSYYYFDYQGLPTTNPKAFCYTCKATIVVPAATENGANRSRHVLLIFSWPANAITPNEERFASTVAQY